MEAKELRIGNLIQSIHGDNCTCTEVDLDLFEALNNDQYSEYDLIPIILTEEWLLKFGFEKYDDGGELNGNDCFYGIKKTGIVIGLTPKFNLSGYRPAKRIIYVHQLQNLYFALTGNELEIK